MPQHSNQNHPNQKMPQEENHVRAAKAKRRKKRKRQKLILMGVLAAGAVILVVCLVLIVRAIVGAIKAPKKPESTASSSSSQVQAVLPPVTNPVAQDPNVWELLLVNKSNPAAGDFKPELKVVSSVGHEFDERAAEDLTAMIAACNAAAEGNSLSIASAFRGPTTQNDKNSALVALFKGQGDDEVAAQEKADEIEPKHPLSDHQTALGVDFVTSKVTETTQSFAETPEYAWLLQNAAAHGFVLRFPENKAEITGITFQPFHFRYVGKVAAADISSAAICLEEYVVQKESTQEPESTSSAVSGAVNSSSLAKTA